MHATAHIAALVQAAARTFPDTVVARVVAPDQGVFAKIASIASAILTIILLFFVPVLGFVGWELRAAYNKLGALAARLQLQLAPVIHTVTLIADDTREIVSLVKGDVRQVQGTVSAANARLLKAVKDAEARIDEFNALIEVIQDEAESAFVGTASTVRGVRSGLSRVFESEEEYRDGDRDGRTPDEGEDRRPARKPRRRSDIA